MVVDVTATPPPLHRRGTWKAPDDAISVISVDEGYACNGLALRGDDDGVEDRLAIPPPTFGNIAVSNSADVHFGSKTYYQGPVTIKKVVYASPGVGGALTDFSHEDNGKDNLAFSESGAFANGQQKLAANGGNVDFSASLNNRLSNNKAVVITIMVCAFALIVIGALVFVLLQENASSKQIDDGDDRTIEDPAELPNGKLRMVSRAEWLANDPTGPLDPLPTPVPYVIIQHTAAENCTTQSRCMYLTKNVQNFHMNSRKWFDIGYNFLVGGDGSAYIGRGWTNMGAHTLYYNNVSIGIAFIGTFTTYTAPDRQIRAALTLIQQGVEQGYIHPDYKLLGACQVAPTVSPGKLLYEKVMKWPHWSNKP